MAYYGFIELEHETLIKNRDKFLKDNEVHLNSGTLLAIRDRIVKEKLIVDAFYKQANDLYKAKVDSKKYNSEYLKETRQDLTKEVVDYAQERKGEINKMIVFTLAEARDRVNNALNKVPTAEQSSFLSVVKSNNHITINEAKGLLPKFADNYMAMRTYQSILEEKGIYLHLPKSYDYNEMLKSLDIAKKHLDKVMSDFDRERKDFKNQESLFFYLNPNHLEEYNTLDNKVDEYYQENIVDVLDNSVLTSPKVNLTDITKLSKEDKAVFYEIINIKDTQAIKERIDKLNNDKVASVLRQIPEYENYLNNKGKTTPLDVKKNIDNIVGELDKKQDNEDGLKNQILKAKETLKQSQSRLRTIKDEKGNDIQIVDVDTARYD